MQVTGKVFGRCSISSPVGPKSLARGFCKVDAGSSRAARTEPGVNANKLKKLKATWGAPTVQIPPDPGMKCPETG